MPSSSTGINDDTISGDEVLPVTGAEGIVLRTEVVVQPLSVLVSAGPGVHSQRLEGQWCPLDTLVADVKDFVGIHLFLYHFKACSLQDSHDFLWVHLPSTNLYYFIKRKRSSTVLGQSFCETNIFL